MSLTSYRAAPPRDPGNALIMASLRHCASPFISFPARPAHLDTEPSRKPPLPTNLVAADVSRRNPLPGKQTRAPTHVGGYGSGVQRANRDPERWGGNRPSGMLLVSRSARAASEQ